MKMQPELAGNQPRPTGRSPSILNLPLSNGTLYKPTASLTAFTCCRSLPPEIPRENCSDLVSAVDSEIMW